MNTFGLGTITNVGTAGTSGTAVGTSANIGNTTTHLIVLRIDFNSTSGTNDTVTMYIDPLANTNAPSVASTTSVNSLDIGTISAIGVNSQTSGMTVDEFRTGSTFGETSGDHIQGNLINSAIGHFTITGHTFTGVGAGAFALSKTGAGTLLLSGANTYAGATNVQAGTLRVEGSVASSTGVVVSNAATFIAGATQGFDHGGIRRPIIPLVCFQEAVRDLGRCGRIERCA